MFNKIKDIHFIFTLYFISYGLIIINDGLFWDDWCFYFNENKDSISNYALSAGLPLNGIILNFFLSLPYSIVIYRISIFLTYLFAGNFFYKIIKEFKSLSDTDRFWMTSIFMLIPINIARISFNNFQHALAYYLFFYASYILLVKKRNFFNKIITLSFYLVSFNTNSFLLFYCIPIFFNWHLSFRQDKNILSSLKIYVYKQFDLIIIPLIYWLIKSIFLPPSGVFDGYNKIQIINILKSPFKSIGAFDNSIVKAFSIDDTNIFIIFIIFLLIFNFTRNKNNGTNSDYKNKILLGFIFFYIAIAPYLYIGRSGGGFGLEWGGRDQLLIPLSASLIIYFFVKYFASIVSFSDKTNLIMSFVIAIFINTNISNYLRFNIDWFKQLSLINQIKLNDKIKSHDKIIFSDKTRHLNGLNREIRFFEFNGMFKESFNDQSRLGISRARLSPNFPKELLKFIKIPEYNFIDFKNINDDILKVQIIPGKYEPTSRGILKLIVFKFFLRENFENKVNDLVVIDIEN